MRLYPTSDWFNPMLVRDLRQGLRTHRFTVTFLLLQLGLAFFIVLSLISPSQSDVVQSLNVIIWVGLFLFYILVLPGTAMSSLTVEFRENRLDLLKLTQMKSRALVWGKWYSLCAQGLLVATSLLPYLILTYFVGGVEITHELLSLLELLGYSALLVGLCVTISCVNSNALRLLTIIIMVIMGFSYMARSTARSYMGAGMAVTGNSETIVNLTFLAALGIPSLWLLLELGAARLAPTAENHDTPQRLVGLALAVVMGIIMAVFYNYSPAMLYQDYVGPSSVLAFLALAWVMIFAASSEPSPYPDAYRLFVRRGKVGRWVGRLLLYQGWPSAVFFIIILNVAVFVLGTVLLKASGESPNNSQFVFFYMLMTPAFLFPMVAGKILARTRLTPVSRYFVITGFCVVVLLMSAIGYAVTDKGIFQIAPCLLPPNAWLILSTGMFDVRNGGDFDPTIPGMMALIIGFPVMFIAIRRAVFYWPKFAELEARAARPKPPRSSLFSAPQPPANPPAADKPITS